MSAHGDDPAPLGGDAREILDAGRAAERLSPRRKAHVRGRIMAAVAAGAATGAAGALGTGASAQAASGVVSGAAAAAESAALTGAAAETATLTGTAAVAKAAGLSLFAKIGVAVTVVTVGAGSLLWSRAHQAPPRAPPAASVESAERPAAAIAPATGSPQDRSEGPVPAADTPGPAEPVPVASTAPSALANSPSGTASAGGSQKPGASGPEPIAPAPSEPPAPASADSLAEETRLLSAAHTELSRGNAAGALAKLDEHAARFPRGTLVPERRAARAMALCKLGRAGDGRTEAGALYGADSKSPLAEKIRRACAK